MAAILPVVIEAKYDVRTGNDAHSVAESSAQKRVDAL
jgi:hypothetical protein